MSGDLQRFKEFIQAKLVNIDILFFLNYQHLYNMVKGLYATFLYT